MERRHLTRDEMLRAVGMLEGGCAQTQVATAFATSKSVICRLWRRYQETGDVAERHTGPRRVTTPAQDRNIIIEARRHPETTAREIVSHLPNLDGVTVSDQTVRNRLREAGLHSRRPITVPALRRGNRDRRLQWAQEHVNWIEPQWDNVIFTDESTFGFWPDSRRVWRGKGELERIRHFQEAHMYRGGSVMVWGGIILHHKTDLVCIDRTMTQDRYIEQVLEPVVQPFAYAAGPDLLYMHDNARPHIGQRVTNWLADEQIRVLPCPPQSPDMNPIEHVWDMLQRRLTPFMLNIHNRRDFENLLGSNGI